MFKNASKQEKVLIFVGMFLIVTGIAGNEWLLANWLCSGGNLGHQSRIVLRILEIISVSAGLTLIFLRRKEYTANISLLIFTLIVFAGLSEAYFRLFNPQISGHSEDDVLYEYDETFGWKLAPGKSGLFISKHEFETKIVINSTGMRDRERSIANPPGKKRIAVLGDSFASSMGVSDQDVFTNIIEEKLLKNVEVLNFGVNGYGPTQELLLLKLKAMNYQPELVVMVIYVGNDFDDIQGISDWIDGYKRPRAVVDGQGRLGFTNIPVPRSISRTKNKARECSLPRSHLVDFIDKRIHYDKNAINFMPAEIRLCKKTPGVEVQEASRLMEAIIRETDDLCKKNKARFLVVVAPTIIQVYPHLYWKRIKNIYNLNDDDYDLALPNNIIGNICREAGIPVLDLTPDLKASVSRGNDVYYFRNQHWNREGEKVVAEAIARFVAEKQLL